MAGPCIHFGDGMSVVENADEAETLVALTLGLDGVDRAILLADFASDNSM